MEDQPYPYTDESPEERKPRRPLVTVNMAGRYVHAGKASGRYNTRDDVTVFVPDEQDDGNWVATLEGSPDDHARAFVFWSVKELGDVIEALQVALKMVKGQE